MAVTIAAGTPEEARDAIAAILERGALAELNSLAWTSGVRARAAIEGRAKLLEAQARMIREIRIEPAAREN